MKNKKYILIYIIHRHTYVRSQLCMLRYMAYTCIITSYKKNKQQ